MIDNPEDKGFSVFFYTFAKSDTFEIQNAAMQKIEYSKPTVNVVMFQYQSQLLAVSTGTTGVTNYKWNSEVEE